MSKVVAKTRMIGGRSLRTDCRFHTRCKLHLDINGDMDACSAESMKWAIAGTEVSPEEHEAERKFVFSRWRDAQNLP